MKTYTGLWEKLITKDNFELAAVVFVIPIFGHDAHFSGYMFVFIIMTDLVVYCSRPAING